MGGIKQCTEKETTSLSNFLLTFKLNCLHDLKIMFQCLLCKEDYDHLKLACKPIFQKINTLYEKASIEVEGKHFDLDILMGGDMKCLQLVLGLGGSLKKKQLHFQIFY
jgi:hypothetical protein